MADSLMIEGSRDTLWNLVSFPGDWQGNASIQNIFETRSGLPERINNEGDKWRLMQWGNYGLPGTNDKWYPVTDNAKIISGRGYWFRQIGELDTLDIGETKTCSTHTSFAITVDSGWNLIGNPFYFPVKINALQSDPGISSFYGQASSAGPNSTNWYTLLNITSDPLEPWKGYAIYYANAGTGTIYLDTKLDVSESPANPGDWETTLHLIVGSKEVGTVKLGQNEFSLAGPDPLDARPMPFLVGEPTLALSGTDDDWLICDMRNSDGTLSVWRLKTEVDNRQSLELTWTETVLPYPAMSLMLKDAITGDVVDMTKENRYRVTGAQQMPAGRLVVYYGRSEEVADALDNDISTLPVSYRIYQNYPNPFNPSTTIAFDLANAGHVRVEIFNVLGQQVRSIVNNQMPAGSYRVDWDGRNGSGGSVATGIYFARLVAGDYNGTTKMLLLK